MGASILDLIAHGGAGAAILDNQEKQAAIDQARAQTAQTQANTGLAQQQQQNAALELQLKQQQLKDAGLVQRAYSETDGSPGSMRGFLLRNGISGPGFLNWQSNDLSLRKSAADLSKEQNETYAKNLSQVGDTLGAIRQLPIDQRSAALQTNLQALSRYEPDVDWTNLDLSDNSLDTHAGVAQYSAAVHKNQAAVAESEAKTGESRASTQEKQQQVAQQKRTQALQELSGVADANSYSQWKQAHPEFTSPAAYSPAWVASAIRSAVPAEKQPEYDLNTMKTRMGLMGNSEYDQFLAAYAQKLGQTPASLTPQQKLDSFSQFAELKQDPVMRQTALAQKNLAMAMTQLQLSQQPTAADAKTFAADLVAHRMAPDQVNLLGGFGTAGAAFKRMVLAEAKRIDPDFSFEDAEGSYQLAKSSGFQQQIRYMDYVGSSIDNVIKNADALANGKIRSLNALINAGKDQVNNVNLAKFNTDRLEVADAIAKILQGGGSGSGTSDAKLAQAQGLIRGTDDPAVVRATLGEVKDLLGKRRSSLTKGTYLEQSQPAAASVPTPATQAEYDALPKGAQFKKPGDPKTYVKQ